MVTGIPQRIRFAAPAQGQVDQSATLKASGGGSRNPVVFTVDQTSEKGVCEVSGTNGATLSYTASGRCVIDANWAATRGIKRPPSPAGHRGDYSGHAQRTGGTAPSRIACGGCVVSGAPYDRSHLVRNHERGGPVVNKWRRTSWQQLIIAQASFLEYERMRLGPDDRQTGTAGQRSSACQASGAARRHLDDARRPPASQPISRRSRGSPTCGAARWSAALLPTCTPPRSCWSTCTPKRTSRRLRQGSSPVCRPACQQTISAGGGPKRCSAHRSARCRPVPAARAGLTGKARFGRPTGGRRPGAQAGCSTGDTALGVSLRDAMQVRMTRRTSSTLASQLPERPDHRGRATEHAGNRGMPGGRPLSEGDSALFQPVVHNRRGCRERAADRVPDIGDGGYLRTARGRCRGRRPDGSSRRGAVGDPRRSEAPPHRLPVRGPRRAGVLQAPRGCADGHRGAAADQGGFRPGFSQLDSQGQILAYALVFGVAQHLVTRFVDQRADDVVNSLPTRKTLLRGRDKRARPRNRQPRKIRLPRWPPDHEWSPARLGRWHCLEWHCLEWRCQEEHGPARMAG